MTVMLPSELGFADDGNLWRSLGGPEGLLDALGKRSLSLRDWFVTAEWATDENLGSHALPLQETVYPIQDYVNVETVAAYRETANYCFSAEGEEWETYPTLFVWNASLFIFQGTHRLQALYELKQPAYYGWFVNLDEA